MLRIIEHIEQMLSVHDCVIIPGFGGFVLQVTPTWYNAEAHRFEPLHKELVFNETLQHNDGLLIESYRQSEATDYRSAYQLVQADVAELKALYEIKDQISSEEYYTRLYEAENKANLARTELNMRWQGMAVWEDPVVYARLRNSSGSVRWFRYVIWIGDSFTGQGTMFFSNMVELPAKSDDLYVLTIDTGNRYVGGYSIGCEVT